MPAPAQRPGLAASAPCGVGRGRASRLVRLGCLLAALLLAAPAAALDRATIQLKWLHHFQFAGYYAALEQGFYREAGLEVTILEGGPSVEVEAEVAEGRADFGVGTSALLLDRARGRDLVVLGQVFQHSAAVLLAPRRSGINAVAEVAGRRFMWSNQHGDILALLKRHGLDESRITPVSHRGDPTDLLEGRADVMVAYGFNEPYVLERAGEPYLAFSPQASGIDFYGDNLFTTRRLAEARPRFVAAFREATLRGWRHALAHKRQTAELILRRYSTTRSLDWLLFEANQVESLVQPALVELGYQSPSRWAHIGEVFADLGMLPPGFDTAAIVWSPAPPADPRPLLLTLLVSGAAVIGLAAVVLAFRRVNRRLEAQVAERREAAAALADREAQLRATMDLMPVGLAVVQGDRIDYVNETFERSFGWRLGEISRVEEWFLRAYPDPAYRAEVQRAWGAALGEAARGGQVVPPQEVHVTCKDGSVRLSLINAQVLRDRLLVIFTDLTERERLQAELLKLQKLESLGVLAGGIAHDFNNLLTGILGNVSLARGMGPADGEVAEILADAEQASHRASDLAHQLLTFARGSAPVKRAVSARRVLEGTCSLALRGTRVASRLLLPPGLPDLEADEGQIGQAFTNVLLNAVQAMPEGGTVTVVGAAAAVEAGGPLALAPGTYLRLSFTDTGPGIRLEDQQRIFDPYFTTKPKGTGLGLASVHSITRKHGGAVTVRSSPGQGATFEFWLPASQGTAAPPLLTPSAPLRAVAAGQRVLVMDDEAAIRGLARRILERLGCQVETCATGEEAVARYGEAQAAGQGFGAVLMDLTIRGGMGGAEAAQRILQLDPAARLVVSSGYSTDPVLAEPGRYGFRATLAKPYQAEEVARALARLLA